jgi:hypothetical protein
MTRRHPSRRVRLQPTTRGASMTAEFMTDTAASSLPGRPVPYVLAAG